MESFFETFARAMIESQTKLFKSAAIHMNRPVTLQDGTVTRRLAPLMKIRVTHGFIDADSTEPTHIINECWGTLSGSALYFDLIEIGTDQPLRLQVK